MKNIKSISIIIPAYNEEKRLPKTLAKIGSFLRKEKTDYEILIIDDGSKDNTRKVAEEFAKKDRRIKLNKKRQNRGKGYSVKEGIMLSKKDFALFSDADLSTPVEELRNFDSYVKEYDVIIGSRAEKNSKILLKQPFYRSFIGKTFNLILRVLSGMQFHDTQCGFKLFRKKPGKEIFKKMKIEGWAFDVEILMRAMKMQYRIKSLPVTWINDAQSRVNPLKDGTRMFFDVIRIKKMIKEENKKKIK